MVIKRSRGQKVTPPMEVYDGDPVKFVVSVNLARRHLSESQRAMVAARLATMQRGRPAYQNPPIGGNMTAAQAADLLSTSPRSVERARTVLDEGTPELIAEVEAGAVSVSAAERQIRENHQLIHMAHTMLSRFSFT